MPAGLEFHGRGLFKSFADEKVALEVLEDVDVGGEVCGFQTLDAEFEPYCGNDNQDEGEPPESVVAESDEEAVFDVELLVLAVYSSCVMLACVRGRLFAVVCGYVPRMIIHKNHPPTEATRAIKDMMDLL